MRADLIEIISDLSSGPLSDAALATSAKRLRERLSTSDSRDAAIFASLLWFVSDVSEYKIAFEEEIEKVLGHPWKEELKLSWPRLAPALMAVEQAAADSSSGTDVLHEKVGVLCREWAKWARVRAEVRR